jgi:hypothetical protein
MKISARKIRISLVTGPDEEQTVKKTDLRINPGFIPILVESLLVYKTTYQRVVPFICYIYHLFSNLLLKTVF